MILLAFTTFWVFNKFVKLAAIKGVARNKWAIICSLLYVGIAIFVFPFIIGVLIELDVLLLDIDTIATQFIISILGYVIGYLVAYVVFQIATTKKEIDKKARFEDFGKKDTKEEI